MVKELSREEKVKKILKRSKEVFVDVSLDNGAIVAANTDKIYYPRKAKNYHYVWPRDASYIAVAANMLGLSIMKPFLEWLEDRPEDFKKEGKIYMRYSTNGRMAGRQFQPDQAGTVLWAIYDIYKKDLKKINGFEALIRRLADGLVDDWKGRFFFTNSVDLWEEGFRRTSTKVENNHTYSLAACAKGLELADRIISCQMWQDAAQQMRKRIAKAYNEERGYILRNHGKIDDFNLDASLLGLVYPFKIYQPDDPRIVKTVKKMEDLIVENGGVHRFQMDYYDGEGSGWEGGGAWPILNFWMSIYWAKKGNIKKAKDYYFWVIDRLEEDWLIPEQIFNDFRVGIKPLAWSHAMFVIASKFLGYLK